MAKTRALISFAVTAKLICVFVFAYAIHDAYASHDAVHFLEDMGFHCRRSMVFVEACST